jgi:PPOX class probable F420-dependent enzyme
VDAAAAHEAVAAARVARLATTRPDGRPHLVPITFALDVEVLLTAVDHKPKTTTALQRLENIASNPAVSVLVDHYEDDWSRLWWVRLDGSAEILTGGRDRERAIQLLAGKYPAYRSIHPEGPVIRIAIERWTAWSA